MSLASSPGQQSPSLRLPASQNPGSKVSKPTSSIHRSTSPASSLGHRSSSTLLSASPRLPSRKKEPKEEQYIDVPRKWVRVLGPWPLIVFVSFIFARESNGAYYRHKLYVNTLALLRTCAMALVKGLLYCISNTLYFLWENKGFWIKEIWKHRLHLSGNAWMLMIAAAVTSFLIPACLKYLLRLTKPFAIAGRTLMLRFIQTCTNKLKLLVIWVRSRPESLLRIPMICWKYLTRPMHLTKQFAIAGWTLIVGFIQTCINELKLPIIWAWSSLDNLLLILIACWEYFMWLMQASPSELWSSMRQPSLASGLRILGLILILIFLIWGIRQTSSSRTYDDWFWGFLNARI